MKQRQNIANAELIPEVAPYQVHQRTRWERFLDRIKPRSAALRTTLLVSIVAVFSLWMSLWLFWRTLYLPEIRQHARYIAAEVQFLSSELIRDNMTPMQTVAMQIWLKQHLGLEQVSDPSQFPHVRYKLIAELFTDRLEEAIAKQLGLAPEQVTVYFQFKPVPQIWIQTPELNGTWLKETLTTYANYSSELLLLWLLGIPLLTSLAILILVRQLNRPLKRLQEAATSYRKTGKARYLATNHGPMEIRQVNWSFNQMISSLQQAEQERRIMLAGISHDLRTPLTRIRLSAEMMSDDDFIKEGLIYDVEDMDAILQQFISYMRDGSDEAVQLTDVNALIQEVVVQFNALEIEFSPQPLPQIAVRALSLKRAIGNLVNNAKRYGQQPIEICTKHTDERLCIVIRDHGEGIPEEQVSALMQPFVRGDSARTIQGSGLGLAIVKRIVDIHQGKMHIQNHPEGGLEVIIDLPLTVTAPTNVHD